MPDHEASGLAPRSTARAQARRDAFGKGDESMSAFMVPEYVLEDFLTVENTRGESTSIPADVALTKETLKRFRNRKETRNPKILASVADYIEGEPASVEFVRGRWWARLSASGYLDATDWIGPFKTLAEARAGVSDTFDCCSQCGGECEPGKCPEGIN
jgi:hypothetical protein